MEVAGVLALFIPIIAILSSVALPIVVAWILVLKKITSIHKERMGMIQQGIIPPNESKRKSTPNRYVTLRNGTLFIALGIGLVVGVLGNQQLGYGDIYAILFVTASTVFFIGIGYLVFFLITKNVKEYNRIDVDRDLEDYAE